MENLHCSKHGMGRGRQAVNICLHCSRDCGKVTHVLTDVDTQQYNTGTLLWINNRVLSSSDTQPLQVLSLTRLSEPKVTGSCLWILKPKKTKTNEPIAENFRN